MSSDSARPYLLQAQDNIAAALRELDAAPPPPPVVVISDPAVFDAALAKAAPGAALTLDPFLVYSKPLTLDKAITLVSAAPGTGRMTKTEAAPRFTAGLKVTGDNVQLIGIDVRTTSELTDIVVLKGAHIIMDRCRVLGDPVKGAKRGIAANSNGDVSILRSFIDDVWQPAQDTCAIGAWDMGPGLTIDDCYLVGGSQSVHFGGGDPVSSDRVPSKIKVTNSTLTKNPAWYTPDASGVLPKRQTKCAIEFKDCIDVLVDNCELEYAGTAQGQGAYLIVATPRNQDGHAPFSTVQNVRITNCRGGFGGGVANFLGSDNVNPSGPLSDLTIRDCTFHDIDPLGPTGGSGRLFTFDRTPKNIVLDNITVTGKNIAALGYFSGPATTGLVLSRMTLPPAKYGWKIDAGGMGKAALQAYAPDAKLDATIV